MGDRLVVAPRFAGTLAHRKASSACCAARLNAGTQPGTYTCRGCGQPCERVLGDPEEVTFGG